MGQNAYAGSNAHAYQYPYGSWSKVLLKQIYQSVRPPIQIHFEGPRVLVAFYHDIKHFVQFSVNQADWIFCAVHLAVRVEC